MIIELPFPNPKLNPNRSSGDSWKSSRKYRNMAYQTGYVQARVALESQTFEPSPFYSIWITFYPPDKRHRDADNLHAAMKHYIDGICKVLEINDALFRKVTIAFGEVTNSGGSTVEIKALGVEE